MYKQRVSVVLTEDEKRAVRFMAFIRKSSESGVVRSMTPKEALMEYVRLRDGLQLTNRIIDSLLTDLAHAKTAGSS